MRTLELLQSLTESELSSLAQELAAGKRKSLQKLFAELKKHRNKENDPDRIKLFEKVFEKKYAKNHDYLLRNALRHLNEMIYEFILFKKFEASVKEDRSLFNLWLARAYVDRKIPLFKNDIDEFVKEAANHYKMEEAAALSSLKANWLANNGSDWDLEYIKKEIKEWQKYEQRKFLYGQRNTEFSEAYFLQPRNGLEAKAFGLNADKTTQGLTTLDIKKLSDNDWYAEYLLAKKYFFQSTGSHRLNYARKACEITGTKKALAVLGPVTHIKAMENLGFCLLGMGRTAEAEICMKETFAVYKKYKMHVGANFVINYMAVLFILKKLKNLLDVFAEYQSTLKGAQNYISAVIMAAYSHLFLNEADEALNILPTLTGLTKGETLEVRYVYLIAFILRGQYELALTEAHNLKRLLQKPELAVHAKKDLGHMQFAQAYVKALTRPKPEAAKLISGLQKKIAQNLNAYEELASGSPFFSWFLERLKA